MEIHKSVGFYYNFESVCLGVDPQLFVDANVLPTILTSAMLPGASSTEASGLNVNLDARVAGLNAVALLVKKGSLSTTNCTDSHLRNILWQGSTLTSVLTSS